MYTIPNKSRLFSNYSLRSSALIGFGLVLPPGDERPRGARQINSFYSVHHQAIPTFLFSPGPALRNSPSTPGAAISSSSHLWFAAVSKGSFDSVEIIRSPQGQQSAAAAIFGLQLSARAALIAWKLSIHPRGSKRQQPSMICSFDSGTILHSLQGQLSAAAATFDLQLSARAAFESLPILHSLPNQQFAEAGILQLSACAAVTAFVLVNSVSDPTSKGSLRMQPSFFYAAPSLCRFESCNFSFSIN
jgi:hypothetical protein